MKIEFENNLNKSTPLALLNISGGWSVVIKNEFVNIKDFALLYEKRVEEKLHDLRLKLEAL